MVSQQISTGTITHQWKHHVQLAVVQERRDIRYEVRMHQLSRVDDLVLYELTIGFRHAVQVEVFHGDQIAALVVFAQEHNSPVRETRTQHGAHSVLL